MSKTRTHTVPRLWAAAVATALSFAGACSGDETTGTGGSGGAVAPYGESECGTCALDACAPAVDSCNGDPGCAAYLECLLACPVGDTGDADAACDAACPIADSSVTQEQVARVRYCRDSGDGATQCPACGKIQEQNPCLNQTCAASTETDACAICEDEACCDLYAAYRANDEAVALRECLLTCPDGACFLDCYDMHPDGVGDWGARFGCIQIFCLSECLDGAPPPCASCAFSKCASTHIDCAKNPSCYLLGECQPICESEGGSTVDCYDQCAAQYPDGVEDFTAHVACGLEECFSECASP